MVLFENRDTVINYIFTNNPYHIEYLAQARAMLNFRERFWQAQLNLVYQRSLNDTRDFNNYNLFRRNERKYFKKRYKWYKSVWKYENNIIKSSLNEDNNNNNNNNNT